MSSTNYAEIHSPCDSSCDKSITYSSDIHSIDENPVRICVNTELPYESTSSPLSISSISTVERSLKVGHQMLSSTLKNHQSFKRRSRYAKLLHRSQIINRQYMMAMSHVLFKMQKEIYKIKRETHHVKQLVRRNNKIVHPIIRIPRLTLDQLSTICVDESEHSSGDNSSSITCETSSKIEQIQTVPNNSDASSEKSTSDRQRQNLHKKHRRRVWINNRQKPIDHRKYCFRCKYEFSKRSNFLLHVKRMHCGQIPTRSDQEYTESNRSEPENIQDQSTEKTNDTSNSLPTLLSPAVSSEMGPMAKVSTKKSKSSDHPRKICDICGKSFRTDYIVKHKNRAHSNINTGTCSINKEISSINRVSESEKMVSTPTTQSGKILNSIGQKATSPLCIDVCQANTNEESTHFDAGSPRRISLVVTCLEPYQIDLVDRFLKKFPRITRQTSVIDTRTTHLIANDEKQHLRSPLSIKLIEAIAHHCSCVSYRWIADCLKENHIIDEEPYEIESDNTESQPHFGPRRSRLSERRHVLFENICFMIKCVESPEMRLSNERLEELITVCGGQIITCVTQRLLEKNQIVVLCDSTYVTQRHSNYDQCRSLGIHFVSSDWVLESILEYNLKSFFLFEEVPS